MDYSVVIVVFVVLVSFKEITASQAERKLINHLFSHYNNRVLPSVRPTEPVHVTIDKFHLMQLTKIDENKGTVDIGVWIDLTWNDTDLSWSPKSYDGATQLTVRASQVWTPDMILLSGWGVPEACLRGTEENDVIIKSTGQIFYFPNARITLPCLNTTEVNVLECNFAVGSWALLVDQLDLHVSNNHFEMSHFVIDSRYEIKGHSLEEKMIILPAYPEEPWELIIARIQLEKRSTSS